MIKIAHLYYDLMNLYGDNGNIKALKYQLERQGIKVSIDFLTIGDKFDFNNYDMLYIGPGTYNNQQLVLKDILRYKKEIKNFIEQNKIVLATGNSIELFGKSIKTLSNKKIKCLNIFEFESEQVDIKLVGETIAFNKDIKNHIIGFQNQNSIIKNFNNFWLDIKSGIGSNGNSKKEGINYNNFYGTYLIGPILVRNPNLLELICKKLILMKKNNFQFKKFDFTLENKAYNEYLQNYLTKKV